MPRNDGRVDPGQPLRSAISARAWNRAQDAADIVLGERYSVTQGSHALTASRLVISVKVQMTSGLATLPLGLAVLLNDAYPKTLSTDLSGGSPYSGLMLVNGLSGSLTTISSYSPLSTGAIGISVDGAIANSDGEAVVPVAISGTAVCRVRKFSDAHRFAVSPVRRIGEQATANHIGILDSHPCACDTSVRVVCYGPIASSFTDATNAPIVWAVVLL